MNGLSPEDSFSLLPYEKGFQFLYHIESMIGEKEMQQILREYVNENA